MYLGKDHIFKQVPKGTGLYGIALMYEATRNYNTAKLSTYSTDRYVLSFLHHLSLTSFVSNPQAVELKPDFRSALFNLALLLSDSGRPLEAAPFLHHLVRHHPDHVKAFILLGDIYVNNMKDLDEAERVCVRSSVGCVMFVYLLGRGRG